MIALAICEIGSLAERRIALLVDPALSGLPAFLTPKPGLNSGFMIAQVTAAALVAENKQRAHPASVDSIPTSANQEDHVSMAAHGARRLAPMADNARRSSASNCSPPPRAATFTRRSPRARRSKRAALLRREVPRLEDDRYFHPDIIAATSLVRRGRVIDAVGAAALPGLESRAMTRAPDWLIVERGDAPLIVSIPHAGTDLDDIRAALSSVRGWRARTPMAPR